MPKSISLINSRTQSALLSVVLLLAANASLAAKSQAAEDHGLSASVIASNESPRRNHALTTLPGQRVAGDTSKQNRIKHFVTLKSLSPNKFGTPSALVRQRLALADQSVTYLSFPLTRPRGRAPPASA
jgi:hypothetical protein